ncbi:MAG: HAD family hydrolase [Planctomycetota bacterium]
MTSDWREQDDQRTAERVESTAFLPGTNIEIIRPGRWRTPPRHVIFDFDGTLSLIREGWPEVMVPMMTEVLQATGTDESWETLRRCVHEYVMQLNGKQTIYQMIRLADEVRRRGGEPEDPLVYKARYHDRLMKRISHRREQLRVGEVPPEAMLVPYTFQLLNEIRSRSVVLHLASGTDESYVLEEARLLGLDAYFGSRIHGARDDFKNFSKAKVIERILAENRVEGSALLGFGDGYVEIQNVKAAGGIAVGVASDEAERGGTPDAWKRDRLVGVGADIVIPDYRDYRPLLDYLWTQ